MNISKRSFGVESAYSLVDMVVLIAVCVKVLAQRALMTVVL